VRSPVTLSGLVPHTTIQDELPIGGMITPISRRRIRRRGRRRIRCRAPRSLPAMRGPLRPTRSG